MSRRLVSTRRSVGAERRSRYDELWRLARAAVEEAGANAWRFAAADAEGIDPGEFLEFLEFGRGSDPRSVEAVAARMAALEEIAPGSAEVWEEAG